MDDLGARLRHAREKQGASLTEIAARTKIAVASLEALERNEFGRLPGGIFGRSFVRAYASEIGLDPETVVEEFQKRLDEFERAAAARGAARPEVTADDREFLARQRRAVRILRIVVTLLAPGSLTFLAWQLRGLWQRRHPPAPAVESAPAASDPPAPAMAISPTPAPLPAAPDPPALPPVATAPLTVEFEVVEDSWIYAAVDGR